MLTLPNRQLLESLVGAVHAYEGHSARDATDVQVVTKKMLSRPLAASFPLENLNKDAEIAANTFKLEDLVPSLRVGHRVIVAKVEDGVIKICYEHCDTWGEFRDVMLWTSPTSFVISEFVSTFFSPPLAFFIFPLACLILVGQTMGLRLVNVKMTARRYVLYILLHLCFYWGLVYFAGDLYTRWNF